jgi:hypothetical protein
MKTNIKKYVNTRESTKHTCKTINGLDAVDQLLLVAQQMKGCNISFKLVLPNMSHGYTSRLYSFITEIKINKK